MSPSLSEPSTSLILAVPAQILRTCAVPRVATEVAFATNFPPIVSPDLATAPRLVNALGALVAPVPPLAIGIGVGIGNVPEALDQLPAFIGQVFAQNGIIMTFVIATVLNLVLPKDKDDTIENGEKVSA